MKNLLYAVILAISTTSYAAAQNDAAPETAQPMASYLLPGAPAFDISISQFREKFNHENPALLLNEFRAIDEDSAQESVLRAASKINENLYSSSALERGTLKIKSIQITWLPIQGPEKAAARAKALNYMAGMIQVFSPILSKTQSQQRLAQLLASAKDKPYYALNDGSLRYVVVDSGENGLTFAIEPIKLALSETIDPSR